VIGADAGPVLEPGGPLARCAFHEERDSNLTLHAQHWCNVQSMYQELFAEETRVRRGTAAFGDDDPRAVTKASVLRAGAAQKSSVAIPGACTDGSIYPSNLAACIDESLSSGNAQRIDSQRTCARVHGTHGIITNRELWPLPFVGGAVTHRIKRPSCRTGTGSRPAVVRSVSGNSRSDATPELVAPAL
jgi:hypothetical protein